MKTKTITVYMAGDGQEFSTPLACEKHEEAKHICGVAAGQVYRDRNSAEKLVIFETWDGKIIFGGLNGNSFKGYSKMGVNIYGAYSLEEAIAYLNDYDYHLEQP